jgi:L-seryl-tRNA(Ser) seleniumtransferase
MTIGSRRETALASALPSVDEMLGRAEQMGMVSEFGRERTLGIIRELIAVKRSELLTSASSVNGAGRQEVIEELAERLSTAAVSERTAGVRRVINATGVVIHTNLGRAPLSPGASCAAAAASGYAAIEYDIDIGSRGPRGGKVISLLRLLTGAEDAMVVNNCAAAALLVMSVFADGREVIVSRGELVEIGGDFRVPDVLTRSGAMLREIGTTNRSHLRDYEKAISERTAMILRVHPSNFRIIGFTKAPSRKEIAALARSKGILFFEDAGSGALIDLSGSGITGEPVIRQVLEDGADLVAFSGDKLLGGPQAGIITGRANLVDKLRRDPFYRAMRVDKMITAALETTLEHYVRGEAATHVPVIQMLSEGKGSIGERAQRLLGRLAEKCGPNTKLRTSLAEGRSAVGGGASPDAELPTVLIEIAHEELSDTELAKRLRFARPPVIARIEAGRVLIDLRTVAHNEEPELLDVLSTLAGT